MNPLIPGFGMIFIAAVAGGAFGLQYRVMRRYSVDNASFLSMLFATIVVPLIAVYFILPEWTSAITAVGLQANLVVFVFGFGWGLGAITYAYGFSILGMALAASLLKGITVAIGSGVPLIRHWHEVSDEARLMTIFGILVLVIGTVIAGKAGVMREKEMREDPQKAEAVAASPVTYKPTGRIFWLGLASCLLSGILSACANLGYEFADSLEKAMGGNLTWRATLIRWMPMYWGGITALTIFMGGSMIKHGTWRNYFTKDSLRDGLISSSMGGVHFLAQIPYGIGAFYLGTLGTTVGWGVNIGMALVVATTLGFLTGEWKGVSSTSTKTILSGIVVLMIAMGILAYANSLV